MEHNLGQRLKALKTQLYTQQLILDRLYQQLPFVLHTLQEQVVADLQRKVQEL